MKNEYKLYSVLVLMHPTNCKGCFEVLFSYDGERYSTVDGNGPDYFKEQGLTVACRFEADMETFYRLMAKSIALKLKLVNLHLKYRDSKKVMTMFKLLSEKCVKAQCNTVEDLDIPEVVTAMANSIV